MTATALPIITVLDSYQTVGALAADYVYTAADVANGNSFSSTGHEIVLVQNTGGSPYVVTVTSTPDNQGRTADLTYTVGAGLTSVLPYFAAVGWRQTSGLILISGANAALKFAVLRLPR